MSNYLAIQTSFKFEEIAMQIGNVNFSHKFDNDKKPAENLAKITKEILKNNTSEISDLDFVIVTQTPGSFTGLRIGITFAKSLVQFNRSIKLIGVNLLEVAEWKFGKKTYLNAGNDRAFVLKSGKIVLEPEFTNFLKTTNELYENADQIKAIDLIEYVKKNEDKVKIVQESDFYNFLPDYILEPRIG